MSCPSSELLAQYLGSELAGSERDHFEAHLEGCQACASLIASLVESTHSSSGPGPSAALVELEVGSEIGRYVVMKEVGRGAMGVVYEGYDAELDRKLALKVIGENAPGRARKEARAMAKLCSPQVVQVHDLLLLGNATVIVMELCTGPTLRQWLASDKRKVGEIRQAFMDAGRGLQAAHGIGIVHCDFKADNVLLGRNGRAKVTDFGLARWEHEAARAAGGTPRYMAPELSEGAPPTASSDQFSFSMSYAEALLGHKLSERERQFKTTPHKVSGELWQALARGASPSATDRFASIEALLEALEPTRSRPWLVTAALASALVLAGGVWAYSDTAPLCEAAADKSAHLWAGRQSGFESVVNKQSAKLASRYAKDWSSAHHAVCKAKTGTELRDLRMRCLGGRQASFVTLVDVLTDSPTARERAFAALTQLPNITECRALIQNENAPPPTDPALRARIEERTSELYRLRSAVLAGAIDEVERPLLDMQASVDELDFAPLTAHYYHQLGILWDLRGDYQKSSDSLDRAAKASALAHEDLRQAHILTLAMAVRGYRMGKVEQGKALAEAARLAIARVNAGTDLRTRFHHNLGMILTRAGVYADARSELKEALGLAETSVGEVNNAELRVTILDAIGTTYYREEKLPEAREHHLRAIALGEEAFGKSHKSISNAVNNLALADWSSENFGDAIAGFERSKALTIAHQGARNPGVAMITVNIGLVYMSSQQLDAAESKFAEALPLLVEIFGEDHLMLATLYSNMAELASLQGDPDQAITRAQKALQLRRALGEDHPSLIDDHFNLAGLLCASGRRSEARGHYRAILEKTADKADATAWLEQVETAPTRCRDSHPRAGEDHSK